MRTHLTFRSDISDEPVWSHDDIPVVRDSTGRRVRQYPSLEAPAGKQHAKLFSEALARDAQAGEPWNEEDYGWEFLCEVDGFSASVLIQPDYRVLEDNEPVTGWLVCVQSVGGWFRKKRREQAVEKVCQMLDAFVKSDNRFRDAHWWTCEEYQAANPDAV